MGKQKHLLVIGGATATGKTAIAIQLARHFNTEILSADSRQFYREMNIGTAKPTPEELSMVTHHFINSLSVAQDYSVGDYEQDAISLLDKLYSKNEIVVMAGGSGLYINAVCMGLDQFPDVPEEVKRLLTIQHQQFGLGFLQKELMKSDPEYFLKVDQNNPHRLMRALAICRVSGKPFSSFLKQERKSRNFKPVYILLETPREELYKRIDIRVDDMMEKGLLDEVHGLIPFRHSNALQTVGYQEIFDYFDGKLSLDQAIEKIKQNSRNYAKRQMTWFHRENFWRPYTLNDQDRIIAELSI